MTERRAPAPVEKPVVLTIAGSDSGGGAGIQADLKTIEATGGFGTSALTAVTAQNTTGVESSHVLPVGEIEAQIDAVTSDFDVRAVKTGMLATAEVVGTVAAAVAGIDAPVVVDPVMVAATGDRLLTEDAESAYGSLIAESTLVTPNADEAAVLTGVEPDDETSARRAGESLLETGADAALIKGGHMPGERVLDVLITPDAVETVSTPRIDTDATHGSGCTLSAAIATRLARGEPIADAVERSVTFTQQAIRYHHAVGSGPGAVHHLVALRDAAEREPTLEKFRETVDRLRGTEIKTLVPDSGTNVAVATPYADRPEAVAAFEGGIGWTPRELEPNGPARFGIETDISRRLLDVRERRPGLRAAFECRFDDDVSAAIDTLGWPIFGPDADSSDENVIDRPGATDLTEGDAFVSAHGETATVLASTPDVLLERLVELADEL